MRKLMENNEIRLRAPEPEDLDVLYKWENDTRLWPLGATTAPFSRFALRQYLETNRQDIYADKQLRLMIAHEKSGETIGTVDLYNVEPHHARAGVGILIDPNFQQKGYGYQALQLLEEYAFSFISLHQLYAVIPETNEASTRLFTKAAFQKVARLTDWLATDEGFMDALLYTKR